MITYSFYIKSYLRYVSYSLKCHNIFLKNLILVFLRFLLIVTLKHILQNKNVTMILIYRRYFMNVVYDNAVFTS